MRRTLAVIGTLALLVAVAPGMAHAQGMLGIKGGVSFGNVSNSGLLPGNLDTRTGFAAGVAFTPMKNELLGLGVEGLYAQRGVKSSSGSDSRLLNYIDVPVYLIASTPSTGVGLFGYTGPQISFEVNCKTAFGTCPSGDRPTTSYSMIFGGGLRFGGPTGAFTVEGRYLYGLTDLKLSTVTSSESYKTRSFLILAGFGF